jgi:hypothetical protein
MEKRPIKIASFMILLLASILACQALPTGSSSTSTPIDDVIPFPVIPVRTITNDNIVPPRWVEFERALASVLLGPPGKTVPDISRDQGWCEWEFWGQKGEQVYVWAECVANNAIGTATSAPAVIYLGEDGHITAVVMPQEGWGNIKTLFPEPVLMRILNQGFDAMAAMDHIDKRRNDPSIPPLIVEQGVEMPLP